MAALGTHQRGDTALGARRLHLVGGEGEPQVVGVTLGQLPDDVDLFERGADGVVPGHVAAHVHRPELRAHAAGAQSRDVGVQGGALVGGDVALVDVITNLLAQRPRQVVVPVDDGVRGEQFAGAGHIVHGVVPQPPAQLPNPKPAVPSTLARSRLPFSVACTFSSSWNWRIRSRSSPSCAASMRTASSPALRAPATETVATGTPAGICTMDSSESIPSRYFSGTGTPITGSGVTEATMPGRCAAPPAPAMITRSPRPAAAEA